jgi:hypothetical protein
MSNAAMKRVRLALGLALLAPAGARAVVVLEDAAFSPFPLYPDGATQLLGLTKSIASGTGACGFFFNSIHDETSGTVSTRITGAFIAELYELFVVPPGVVFDAAYVATHEPVASNTGTTPPFLLPYEEGQSSLFAFWDDRSLLGGGGVVNEADAVDLYGWVAIDYTLDEDPVTFVPTVSWSVRDGATATGLGIVTGTYNQIPEPAASAALAAFAVLGAQILRRQRRFG